MLTIFYDLNIATWSFLKTKTNRGSSEKRYSAYSNGNIWMITFYYHHSSSNHNIVMALNSASSLPTISPISTTTSTSIPTPTSATATTNLTNSTTASPTSTLTPSTPEFPLVFLPLILVMASLAIGVLLKKRAKKAA